MSHSDTQPLLLLSLGVWLTCFPAVGRDSIRQPVCGIVDKFDDVGVRIKVKFGDNGGVVEGRAADGRV